VFFSEKQYHSTIASLLVNLHDGDMKNMAAKGKTNRARFPGRNTRSYRRLKTQIIRIGGEYLAAVLDGQQVRWQGSYRTWLDAATEAAFNRLNEAAIDWCTEKFGQCLSVEFQNNDVYVEY
jgi:hypothetical protein